MIERENATAPPPRRWGSTSHPHPRPARGARDLPFRCYSAPMPRWSTQLRSLSGVLATLTALGCAPPIPDGGFDAPDPASRIYAAVGVAKRWNSTTPPESRVRPPKKTLQHLVVMLQSSDPVARLIAGDTLKLVTGRNFGFDPSGATPARFEAVERWRAWVDTLPDETAPAKTVDLGGTAP